MLYNILVHCGSVITIMSSEISANVFGHVAIIPELKSLRCCLYWNKKYKML